MTKPFLIVSSISWNVYFSFVKGSCLLDNCLLSHNVTLSKMPTCKFFLAKMCFRPNCPYLHKKVNAKTAICEQFVAGFCPEAEKVNTFIVDNIYAHGPHIDYVLSSKVPQTPRVFVSRF